LNVELKSDKSSKKSRKDQGPSLSIETQAEAVIETDNVQLDVENTLESALELDSVLELGTSLLE
jgi:hypothetical protein